MTRPVRARATIGRRAVGVRWITAAVAAVLAACGGDGDRPEGAELETAIVEARTRGQAHLQRDRLDDAEAEFRRLAELAPEEGAGPANLALVELRRGDAGAAERRAREAVERAPDDPWVRLVLAEALEMQGREGEAREERRRALELDPGNLRALWALAGGGSEDGGAVPSGRRQELLARVVEEAPSNVAARLGLAEARLRAGRTEAAAAQLEELRSLVPEFPADAEGAFDRALDRARAGDAGAAREAVGRLHDAMRLTLRYQGDLEELRGPRGEATGFPALSFSHEISLEVPDEDAVLDALQFSDATEVAGLDALGDGGGSGGDAGGDGGPEPVVAVGDYDGDGDPDLYVWTPGPDPDGRGRLLRNELGEFVDATPDRVGDVGRVRAAAAADYDGDGHTDLLLVRDGANRLLRNRGDGRFEDVTEAAGVGGSGEAGVPVFADLDHDGDLDLLVASDGTTALHRNDGDGGFTRVPGAMGLDAGEGPARDVDFADVDDDADLDLVTARGPAGVDLFANLRQDRFLSMADSAGLAGAPSADVVALGDYDNDGRTDVFVGGSDGPAALHRNLGDGRFEAAGRPGGLPPDRGVGSAAFLDFDNDGRLDLAVGGTADDDGLVLLHNEGDGEFADMPGLLPPDAGATRARVAAVFDYNRDGDLDLLAATGGGVRLLRNDGGSVNHHFELRLVARGPGSGKVNRHGIGSKVEVRAGDLYQTRTVTGPTTHFGLGHRLKADVVRIVWTNGVPQHLHFPGSDQDLIEEQQLKGSCVFVYAWDGEGFAFVTDAAWRSALGMPVGIMGEGGGRVPGPGDAGPAGVDPGVAAAASSGRTYASPAASREYVRIPPDRLEPRDGRYRLQITEELWEVAYVDEMKLVAVDHPASERVLVDEAFAPPSPPELRTYRVREPLPPAAARDGEGNDLLPALRARDHRYASNLAAGPHQGIVEPHEVVLELPREAAEADRPFLFLRGWLFPTDASINVAVSQSDSLEVASPRLEVPDGDGGWTPAEADVGFPAGKAKTVVVDLGGVVPADDPRVRIRTNMQIYWDRAFFAAGPVAGPAAEGGAEEAVARLAEPSVRLLRPEAADLHFRGFSREYRKGGRHGPHWFDYDDVSPEPRWLPIPGRYTRYGDVRPLLEAPDDMYVVMAPGDEMTVDFDAGSAGELPEGWTRTFFLYTDGWLKDADLNTATGDRVGPMPFHGQGRYPYGPETAYPRDSAHRAYLERYQTREVAGSALRLAPGSAAEEDDRR